MVKPSNNTSAIVAQNNNDYTIPKEGHADDVRMVAAMASVVQRNNNGIHAGRAWDASIAHEDDSPKPVSSCLQAMEDRQCLLDILNACDFDTLEYLLRFVTFYDAIDP